MANSETGVVYGGALWSEHNHGEDTPLEFEGSIALNVEGIGGLNDQKQSGVHTFTNDAMWNDQSGLGIGPLFLNYPVTSMTFSGSTATIQASNAFSAGNIGYFVGLTGSAAVLNNTCCFTVLAAGLSSTQFEITYTGAAGGPYTTSGNFWNMSGDTLPTTNVSHMTIGNITGAEDGGHQMWGVE
jgi:hypothetical protein